LRAKIFSLTNFCIESMAWMPTHVITKTDRAEGVNGVLKFELELNYIHTPAPLPLNIAPITCGQLKSTSM
jgi:hypothetical protein